MTKAKTTWETKKIYKDVKHMIDNNPEIIGYIMEKDFLIVTNPCRIPLEILEKQIKENKKHPLKEGQYNFIGQIMIKIPKNIFKNDKNKNRKNSR